MDFSPWSAFYVGMGFGLIASLIAFALIRQKKVNVIQLPPAA